MAVQARELGIDHVVLGQPMSFWKRHMPAGMVLRSGCEWHLDPTGRHTFERFLETRGQTPSDVEPLSLDFYLEYAEWFQKVNDIHTLPLRVTRLDERDDRFVAELEDGTVLTAKRVLLALGFRSFAHIPDELAALLPAELSSHTCDCAAPGRFAGQRVLIVGGRQSAFESAALLAEAGARAVHVCHRHETPAFVASDWSWVDPLLQRIGNEPGWYRGLSNSEREALNARFWAEGRLKLEPWLGPRLRHEAITIRPKTRVVGSEQGGGAAARPTRHRRHGRGRPHPLCDRLQGQPATCRFSESRQPYRSHRVPRRLPRPRQLPSDDGTGTLRYEPAGRSRLRPLLCFYRRGPSLGTHRWSRNLV